MHRREETFAQFLDRQNKTWLYEPKRFRLKTTTYKPDFYCPEDDIYYEVVGTRQAFHSIKPKIKEFIKKYPDINFEIVTPDGKKLKRKIAIGTITPTGLIQRHVLIPKDLDQRICEIAKKKDMKITAIIRQALREFLEMQRIREE